jgi:hypothetical protein
MEICQATRTDGQPCRAPAQEGRPFCFFHDPEQEEARITASRTGGLRKRRRAAKIPTAAELDPEEVRAILAGVVEAAITGALDTATARTVGYLLQVEARIRESGDQEKRIAALEEALKRIEEARV